MIPTFPSLRRYSQKTLQTPLLAYWTFIRLPNKLFPGSVWGVGWKWGGFKEVTKFKVREGGNNSNFGGKMVERLLSLSASKSFLGSVLGRKLFLKWCSEHKRQRELHLICPVETLFKTEIERSDWIHPLGSYLSVRPGFRLIAFGRNWKSAYPLTSYSIAKHCHVQNLIVPFHVLLRIFPTSRRDPLSYSLERYNSRPISMLNYLHRHFYWWDFFPQF